MKKKMGQYIRGTISHSLPGMIQFIPIRPVVPETWWVYYLLHLFHFWIYPGLGHLMAPNVIQWNAWDQWNAEKKKRSFMKRKWYKAEYKKATEEMETTDRF